MPLADKRLCAIIYAYITATAAFDTPLFANDADARRAHAPLLLRRCAERRGDVYD